MSTLAEQRKRWEYVGDSNRTVVKHFEPHKDQVWITILRESHDGNVLYDMVRYFRIGDDVVTSADLQRVDVIELIDFMGLCPRCCSECLIRCILGWW